MGPPGAGKGTQSEKIVAYYNIPHISTGDMFRDAASRKTELGLKAKEYMDKGQLVPDEVTIAIVKDRLSLPDCANGYLLDGFPRTLVQAEALKKLTAEINRPITHAVNLIVDEEKLVDRIASRRVCPQCGASYNVQTRPSKVENVCDSCGHDLIQRDDDSKFVLLLISQRLYHLLTSIAMKAYLQKLMACKILIQFLKILRKR